MLGTVTPQYIQAQYNLGERNFPKLQLRRMKLKNAKLRSINLTGSDLSYADLRDADLTNANLSNCYLNEANLTGAKLSGANLQGVHFVKAYLSKVNFYKANLKDSYLTGSFLTKANFSKANLSGTILHNAHLCGAIFTGALYDNGTRLDRGLDAEALGMNEVSSFQGNVTKKIVIADVITNFENMINVTANYLGYSITVKNFENSRPQVEWLNNFTIDKKGKITFSGIINQQATIIQLRWLEKWSNAFVKSSSCIIQDLPDIIQQKHLTVDYLLKKNAA